LQLRDRSVYVSDDDANYRTVTKTYVFSNLAAEQLLNATGPSTPGNPRPTSIDCFALDTDRFFTPRPRLEWASPSSGLTTTRR
jgi:hypothetical protein